MREEAQRPLRRLPMLSFSSVAPDISRYRRYDIDAAAWMTYGDIDGWRRSGHKMPPRPFIYMPPPGCVRPRYRATRQLATSGWPLSTISADDAACGSQGGAYFRARPLSRFADFIALGLRLLSFSRDMASSSTWHNDTPVYNIEIDTVAATSPEFRRNGMHRRMIWAR